ncbi:MAG: hypothetical protein V1794_02630 [Candidatus Glassbacteria bacterium]
MRYLVLLTSVIFLLSAGIVAAQKGQVNFSGKWALNTEKSDLGDNSGGRRGGMPASAMTVDQKDNKLVVSSTRKNRDGADETSTATYTLDGKECKNESPNRVTLSTAKWAADSKSLTISSTITGSRGGQEFTTKATEIWSMAEGMLSLKTTRTTQRGESTTTAVYNKS